MDPTALPTYQNLPEHLRRPFLNAVGRNPTEWLLLPQNDEVFDTFDHCFARLHAYALGHGFAVTKGKSWTITPRRQYLCIHHSSKTRNDRRLEEEVERDSEKRITSRRQRNSVVNQKWDCKFEYFISYKSVSWRSKEKGYILN